MTAEEALLEVQQALNDRGLPGSVGLRTGDRTFIVGLRTGDRGAVPAVAWLLEQMGMEIVSNGDRGVVLGRLAGGLLPAPPVPPVHVSSSDSATAAEGGQPVPSKKCRICGQVKDRGEFSSNGSGKVMPACRPCDRARQKAQREARMARAASS